MISKHKFCLILIGLLSFALIGSSKVEANDDNQIKIPATIGTVIQRYTSASDRHIVHIRDVHCNYHVQQNIAAIVKMLVEDYGYTLITTEGAAGKVDTSLFQVLPDQEAKEAVCKDYLKSGFLSGVEYLSIVNPDLPVSDYRGIENASLYVENLSQFKQVVAGQPSAKEYLENLLDGSLQIAAKVLPEDLFKLETNYQNYRRSIAPIDQYIAYIDNTAHDLNISSQEYINLHRYLSIVHVTIDATQLSAELYTAIKQLGTSKDKTCVETLRKVYIDYTLHRITDEDLANCIRPYFSNAEDKYPSIATFIDIMRTKQQLDYDALTKELGSLTSKCRTSIIESHNATNPQKQNWLALAGIMQNILLYEKLVSLDLSHNEYQTILKDLLSLDDIVKELSSINKEYNAADNSLFTKKNDEILNDNIKTAFSFYSTADKRSCAMLEKLLAIMQTTKNSKAILLTGGFHSLAMETQLKNMDIAHTVIKPNIQPVDSHIYTSRMMQCSVSPILDVHKTSSAAIYLSLPVLFDTILTKTDYFEQIRSIFARRLLTYKGLPIMEYYKTLSSSKEQALFDDLLALSNLRLDLTISLGEMLHMLDIDTVSDYIMQYTDAVLLEEAKSMETKFVTEDQLAKNQIFIVEYMIAYLDYLIHQNEQYPEIITIHTLSNLYKRTDMPEMQIVHGLIGKHLEGHLTDAISHFLLFNNFLKLPTYTSSEIPVFTEITVWPVVANNIDFKNPAIVQLTNNVIANINEQLNIDTSLQSLIKQTQIEIPPQFHNMSTVTVESVTDWAYEHADVITKTYVSPVRLPFKPNQIQEIKQRGIKAYEQLRATTYEISRQYGIDLNDLIYEISAMIWLFNEFDRFDDNDLRTIRYLYALDLRFLREKGYLFYIREAMQMKSNPVFLIDREVPDIDKELLETILHDIEMLPDEILNRFPEHENVFMLSMLSSFGTARARNIGIDSSPFRGDYTHKIMVHELVGHKLLFVLVSDAIEKQDFTHLESLLSGQDIIRLTQSTLSNMHTTEDIRLVARDYKEYVKGVFNTGSPKVQKIIDSLPSVFEEYNAQQALRYRVHWNDKTIMNISYKFLDWLSENHVDALWILFASGIHFEDSYKFTYHTSIFGHKIYDFLFADSRSVDLISFLEIIAYAMVYDQRPELDASGVSIKFNEQVMRKARHILSSKLLSGWLWHPDKGWFYNGNPEKIAEFLINLEGPDNLLRLSIANNKYFKHLFPNFMHNISDKLIPAIQDKDLTGIRTILDLDYLEAWGIEQQFKKFHWVNYVSGETLEAPQASYLRPSLSIDDLQLRQTIADTLLSAGFNEEPLLVEEIARLYNSIYQETKDNRPIPLASFDNDLKSRNALKNIMISRHASYFPYIVNLCRKLNIKDPYMIPFMFSAQNLLMEYMDLKEEKEVRPIERVKSFGIVGESL